MEQKQYRASHRSQNEIIPDGRFMDKLYSFVDCICAVVADVATAVAVDPAVHKLRGCYDLLPWQQLRDCHGRLTRVRESS